jgi:ABC-2 type transport system permease protein
VSRIWQVFQREYLENVRTKAFLIGLILTPLWFVLVFAVPKLARDADRPPQRVVVVDETGILAADLEAELGKAGAGGTRYDVEVRPAEGAWARGPGGEPPLVERLAEQASEGDLFAVVLTPPVLEKRPPREGEHPTRLIGATSQGAVETGKAIEDAVNRVVNMHLLRKRDLPTTLLDSLRAPAVRLELLARGGKEGGVAQMVAPMAFMLLLFMGIVGISQMLVSTTLEEKSNRVYEVLLSSVSPFQLMTGKLLGVCAVGFTLMVLWSGGGLLAASMQGVTGLLTGGQGGLLIAYYVLGFFLIASLMAAVGSACNTLKEAQNLMAPLSLLLAFPLLLSIVILRDPNGTIATAASFFPPFTPFLMMARLGSVPPPPAWQVPASLLLLALSTWVSLRLSARIFRVGILLYGQPPRLKDIWRWIRSPD